MIMNAEVMYYSLRYLWPIKGSPYFAYYSGISEYSYSDLFLDYDHVILTADAAKPVRLWLIHLFFSHLHGMSTQFQRQHRYRLDQRSHSMKPFFLKLLLLNIPGQVGVLAIQHESITWLRFLFRPVAQVHACCRAPNLMCRLYIWFLGTKSLLYLLGGVSLSRYHP